MFVTRTGFRTAQHWASEVLNMCVQQNLARTLWRTNLEVGKPWKTITIFSEEAPNCWGFQVVQLQGHLGQELGAFIIWNCDLFADSKFQL